MSKGARCSASAQSTFDVLGRDTQSDSAHAGFALNGDKSDWRWSVVGNADVERSKTGTDRDDPSFDRDRARQTRIAGDLVGGRQRQIVQAPRGRCRRDPAGRHKHRPSRRHEADARHAAFRARLSRTQGNGAINLDVPISRRKQRLLGARQSDAQRQCRGPAIVRFRNADPDRRRRQLVAGRPAEPARQLEPRGWRADHPAIGRRGARDPGRADLRFHHRRDGAGDGHHRRQSGARSPTAARYGSWAAIGSRSRTPTCAFAPNSSIRRSSGRCRTSSGRRRRSRPPSPSASCAIRAGTLISADLRPINFDEARARHASARLRLHQAAQVAAPVAVGDRPAARAIPRRPAVGARRTIVGTAARRRPVERGRRPRRRAASAAAGAAGAAVAAAASSAAIAAG